MRVSSNVLGIISVLVLCTGSGCGGESNPSKGGPDDETVVTPTTLSMSGGELVQVRDGTALFDLGGVEVLIGGHRCVEVELQNRNLLTCRNQGSLIEGAADVAVINRGGAVYSYSAAVTFTASVNGRLNRLYAVGGAEDAGVVSGRLTPGGQRHAASALVARQTGAYFGLPLLSAEGLPSAPAVCDADPTTGIYTPDSAALLAALSADPDGRKWRLDPDLPLRNFAAPGLSGPADLSALSSDELTALLFSLLLDPSGTHPSRTILDLLRAADIGVLLVGPGLWSRLADDADAPMLVDLSASLTTLLTTLLELPSSPVVLISQALDPILQPGRGLADRRLRYRAYYINSLLARLVKGLSPDYDDRLLLVPANDWLMGPAYQDAGAVERFGGTLVTSYGSNGEPNLTFRTSEGKDCFTIGYDALEGLYSLDGETLSYTGKGMLANSFIAVINEHLELFGIDAPLEYADLCAINKEDPFSSSSLAKAGRVCDFPSQASLADAAGPPARGLGERCQLGLENEAICPGEIRITLVSRVLTPGTYYQIPVYIYDTRGESVPVKNCYVSAWTDNSDVSILTGEGTTDEYGKTQIELRPKVGAREYNFTVYLLAGGTLFVQTFIVSPS